MEVKTIVVGNYQTNCYLLFNDDECLIIDPGASPRSIIRQIGDRKVVAILLTHGHFDHTGAVDELYKEYGCPIYGCKNDEPLFKSDILRGFYGESSVVNSPIRWFESDYLKIGSFEINIYFTPGHSSGSVMFKIDDKLFSGDTLFYESVGRTDLYSGSLSQLKQSLRVVYQLPGDMIVYPGHESITTVEHEIKYNPYL